MAASRGQRIGIWIIAIFMAIGTIGSFAIIILGNQNQKATKRVMQSFRKNTKTSLLPRQKNFQTNTTQYLARMLHRLVRLMAQM